MNDPKRFQDLEEYERLVAKEAGSSTATRTDRAKVDAALGRLEEDGFIILENLLTPAFVENLREEILAMLGPVGATASRGFKRNASMACLRAR